MSSSTYTLENAKSGRSSCKKCKVKIEKNDLRIGVHIDTGDMKMTSWYHPSCFKLPRKLIKEGVDAETFVTNMLIDESVDRHLNDEELIQQINSKPEQDKKKSTNDNGGGLTIIGQIQKNLERVRKASGDEDEEELGERKRKKSKKQHVKQEKGGGGSLSENDVAIAKAYEFYEKYKNDELKDVLRWNKQRVTGSKQILLQRILDGHVNGRLGKCPTCEKGRLKLVDDDWNEVFCNGYFDEVMMVRNPCFFKCKRMDAPRLKPWYTEEPPEEEEEEEEKETTTKNSPLSKLQSEAKKLEEEGKWDLSSSTTLKSSAKAMVKLCTEKIDIPSSQSKAIMEVGKLILRNKSSTASDFVELLANKFGLKETNETKKQDKTKAATAACGHPGNGPLMAAMLELAELYFKEKNTNAGITYKKVAEAIKGLTFEITEDNAKGLGKGKTKVAGVGKSSADKMYEFVTTGTMEKLEEKRACAS